MVEFSPVMCDSQTVTETVSLASCVTILSLFQEQTMKRLICGLALATILALASGLHAQDPVEFDVLGGQHFLLEGEHVGRRPVDVVSPTPSIGSNTARPGRSSGDRP